MWRYAAGILLFGGIAGYLVRKGLGSESDMKTLYFVGALVFVPFIAWYASRLVIHGGFDFADRLRGNLKKEWNGIYYEYGTVHLRALEHGDALVFVEDDILHLIEQPKSTTLQLFGPTERVKVDGTRWRALTETGCRRLLIKCPHPQAKALLLYLEREAFGPFAKRRDRFGS